MKIRYDEQGQILAVGDDACDWPAPVLLLDDHDAPADLLAALAPGGYLVKRGKLIKSEALIAAFALPETLAAALAGEPAAAMVETNAPTPVAEPAGASHAESAASTPGAAKAAKTKRTGK